jgi:hypothetical protein
VRPGFALFDLGILRQRELDHAGVSYFVLVVVRPCFRSAELR